MYKYAVVMLMAAASLHAVDVRVIGGGIQTADGLKRGLGVEVAGQTSKRGNGLQYEMKASAMTNDFKVEDGGYVALDIDAVFRFKHKVEGFVGVGAVYKSLDAYDNAYGGEYFLGARYTWCSGYQLGLEYKHQALKFQSGQPSTKTQDGTVVDTDIFLVSMGWRF